MKLTLSEGQSSRISCFVKRPIFLKIARLTLFFLQFLYLLAKLNELFVNWYIEKRMWMCYNQKYKFNFESDVVHLKKVILNPISMFIIGLLLGIISRLLDIYTQNLGNIFSQMAIWILLGTLISIYSESKKKAMMNIFPFCIGMLATYYAVAMITKGVYSSIIIAGWTIFAFFSPILAYFTWITKEKGIFPKIISIGIVLISIFSSIILFDGFRVYDFVIDGLLIYVLFLKKIER